MSGARAAWEAANTVKVGLKLQRSTDADILHRLAAEKNKQGYIKALIREDIARRARLSE